MKVNPEDKGRACVDYIQIIQDKIQWQAFMNMVDEIQIVQNRIQALMNTVD
jgi:hypothetical protein